MRHRGGSMHQQIKIISLEKPVSGKTHLMHVIGLNRKSILSHRLVTLRNSLMNSFAIQRTPPNSGLVTEVWITFDRRYSIFGWKERIQEEFTIPLTTLRIPTTNFPDI